MTVSSTPSLSDLIQTDNTSVGFRYGGTASTVCNLFCGYLLPVRNMSGWIEWLHKIDPVYYAFENVSRSQICELSATSLLTHHYSSS